MNFEIIVAPDAAAAMRQLDARTRSEVRDQIELHLRHEPAKLSKSRIKRLRGLLRPQYRLRVGEVRVYYDVVEAEVQYSQFWRRRKRTSGWMSKGFPNEKDLVI